MRLVFACVYKLISKDYPKIGALYLSLFLIFAFIHSNLIVLFLYIKKFFFVFHICSFDIPYILIFVIAFFWEYVLFLHKKSYKKILLKYKKSYLFCRLCVISYTLLLVFAVILV